MTRTICEDCGGTLEAGTCTCAMSEKITQALMKSFKMTREELCDAFDRGDIYLTSCGHAWEDSDAIIEENVIPITSKKIYN